MGEKTKIIEAAGKLVAKGSFDKAIREYQKLLEKDPGDARVLQKLGELYLKKSDNEEAARCFVQVAESYSADGFFLKAVALYKQVLKLTPELMEINLKLAELHQQLGLMSEATAYFQLVASQYEKQGNTKASLDALRRMVDLDPENISSRTKLAELFAREQMNEEAVVEFKKVAEQLELSNRTEDLLRVLERISFLQPDNAELARELAEKYLSLGDQKKALAKLQICFKSNPKDIATLEMLAEAFAGLGQTMKRLAVYKELARIHADQGRQAESTSLWSKVAELDPSDPDVLGRRSSIAAPMRSSGAGGSVPPPPPSSVNAAVRGQQIAKLLAETDVYVKYGLHDKALEHLRRVFQVDAENLEAHEKAYHIYVQSKQHAHAADQLLNVLRLMTRQVQIDRAQSYLNTLLEQNPLHEEVHAFLAILRPEGLPGGGMDDVGEVIVQTSDEEMVPSESASEPAAEVTAAPEAAPPEPAGWMEDDAAPSDDYGDIDVNADEFVAAEAPPPPPRSEVASDEDEDPVIGELDEATFFMRQGLFDEAREILETVLIARPGHRAAKEILDKLESMAQGAAAVAAAPEGPSVDLAAQLEQELQDIGTEAPAPESSEMVDDFQYSVDEVFSEFKKGLEKVVKPEDVDTHYDLGIAYKEMGLVDDAIGEFQVAREGCLGKKKEIDCLSMTALLQGMKGEWAQAIDSLKAALGNEHATGELATALSFELGAAQEAAGAPGKALFHFQRVAEVDPDYRGVQGLIDQLVTIAQPEVDEFTTGAQLEALAT